MIVLTKWRVDFKYWYNISRRFPGDQSRANNFESVSSVSVISVDRQSARDAVDKLGKEGKLLMFQTVSADERRGYIGLCSHEYAYPEGQLIISDTAVNVLRDRPEECPSFNTVDEADDLVGYARST